VSATLAGLVIVATIATSECYVNFVPYMYAFFEYRDPPHGFRAYECGADGVSVGQPVFMFLVMVVPNAMIYSLVANVAALNEETSRQIQILQQFQFQGRAAGSDELYTAVSVTRKGLSTALQLGDSVPALFGLPLNVRVSIIVRLFLICVQIAQFCFVGVSLHLVLTVRTYD
jgi:hypothetical protein